MTEKEVRRRIAEARKSASATIRCLDGAHDSTKEGKRAPVVALELSHGALALARASMEISELLCHLTDEHEEIEYEGDDD